MRRRKIIFVLIMVMSFAATFAGAAPAAVLSCSPGEYTVGGSQPINARLSASTDARVVRSFAVGTTLTVIGQTDGVLVGSNGIWCQITYNGQTLYVHSGALVAGGASTPVTDSSNSSTPNQITGSTIYHVAGGNRINARSAPSTSASIVTQIPTNTDVIVVGQSEGTRVNTSTIWFTVNYNGQQMYVHSSLLTPGSVAPAAQPSQGNTEQITQQQPTQSPAPQQPPASQPSGGSPFQCNGADDLNCSAFSSQAAAQAHLNMCGNEDRLDGNDNDGRACESLP